MPTVWGRFRACGTEPAGLPEGGMQAAERPDYSGWRGEAAIAEENRKIAFVRDRSEDNGMTSQKLKECADIFGELSIDPHIPASASQWRQNQMLAEIAYQLAVMNERSARAVDDKA